MTTEEFIRAAASKNEKDLKYDGAKMAQAGKILAECRDPGVQLNGQIIAHQGDLLLSFSRMTNEQRQEALKTLGYAARL